MAESMRKFEYRGHKVELTREDCLGGWAQTYYYITDRTGYELACDFSESEDTLETWETIMKERIDEEIKEEHPWGVGSDWTSEGERCVIKEGGLVAVEWCEVSYP